MKQLKINPAMDKIAANNGLSHWSCTDPMGAVSWLRSDGLVICDMNWRPLCKEHSMESVMVFMCARLHEYDNYTPIGKDWQQPCPYNLDVIRKSYGFTIDINGQMCGLVAGDMGYEDTGMFVDDACKEAINAITENPTLVQKPFKFPCDGALYFNKTDCSQVYLLQGQHYIEGNYRNPHVYNKELIVSEKGSILWTAAKGKIYDINTDGDLLMFIWE